jgi:hypothetical protein
MPQRVRMPGAQAGGARSYGNTARSWRTIDGPDEGLGNHEQAVGADVGPLGQQIGLDQPGDLSVERNTAFLVALADHPYSPVGKVDIADRKSQHLRRSQTERSISPAIALSRRLRKLSVSSAASRVSKPLGARSPPSVGSPLPEHTGYYGHRGSSARCHPDAPERRGVAIRQTPHRHFRGHRVHHQTFGKQPAAERLQVKGARPKRPRRIPALVPALGQIPPPDTRSPTRTRPPPHRKAPRRRHAARHEHPSHGTCVPTQTRGKGKNPISTECRALRGCQNQPDEGEHYQPPYFETEDADDPSSGRRRASLQPIPVLRPRPTTAPPQLVIYPCGPGYAGATRINHKLRTMR